MKPKISVIVPLYNSEGTIKKSINSILNQTYKDFEIIIIDDGSTDKSKIKIKNLIDNEKVRYYYIKHSGKPSIVRNFGIKKAKSEYIAFNDADDIWFNRKLEMQVKFINQFGQDFGFIFHDSIIKQNNQLIAKSYVRSNFLFEGVQSIKVDKTSKSFIFDGKSLREQIIKGFFITSQSVLVKKMILEKYFFFDESLTFSEDIDLWMKIAKDYNIGYVDIPLFIYNKGSTSITVRKRKFGINQNIKYLLKQKMILDKEKVNKNLIRILDYRIIGQYICLSFLDILDINFKKGFNNLIKAIKLNVLFVIVIILKKISQIFLSIILSEKRYKIIKKYYRIIIKYLKFK